MCVQHCLVGGGGRAQNGSAWPAWWLTCACGFLVPADATIRRDDDVKFCLCLFSGTRWVAKNKRSTMSWRDANGSCTCSSILIGRPAPTPLAARRGSVSKTLKTEVATRLSLTSILATTSTSTPILV